MSHSEQLYLSGMALDIQGVLVLMWGATVPLSYYSFPNSPSLVATYLCANTLLALACSAAAWGLPVLQGPHLGHSRAVLFSAFGGGSFVAPVVHGMLLGGVGEQAERVGLRWIATTAICNSLGAGIYMLKVRSI